MKKVKFLILTLTSLALTCSKGFLALTSCNPDESVAFSKCQDPNNSSVDICHDTIEDENTQTYFLTKDDLDNNLKDPIKEIVSKNPDRVMNNWLSKMEFTIPTARINFKIDKEKYVSDIYIPNKFDINNIWFTITGLTETTQANKVDIKYTKDSNYITSLSLSNLDQKMLVDKVSKSFDENYSSSPNYRHSDSITKELGALTEASVTNVFADRYANMQLINFIGYYPVMIRSYAFDDCGNANIKYKSYALVKVMDKVSCHYPAVAYINPFPNAYELINEKIQQTDKINILGEIRSVWPIDFI